MRPFWRALAFLVAAVAAGPASAQTIELVPFRWQDTVTVGSAAGRRPVDRLAVLLDAPGVPGKPVSRPNVEITADGAVVRATLTRTVDGGRTAVDYELAGDGTPEPVISYQQDSRSLGTALPGFTSPAAGDLTMTTPLENLCSVVFTAEATRPTDRMDGLGLLLRSDDGTTFATFQPHGEVAPAGTDPAAASSPVAATLDGLPALLGELLVPPDHVYTVTGSATLDGESVPISLPAGVYVGTDCHVTYLGAPDLILPPMPVGPPPAPGTLEGTLLLEDDGAAPGPHVTGYLADLADVNPFDLRTEVLFDVPAPADHGPGTFSHSLYASEWQLGVTAHLAWPDGREGEVVLPRALDTGFWSPTVPLPIPSSPPFDGFFPNGAVSVYFGQTEAVALDAPMAFAHGTVNVRGCATPADVVDGSAEFRGVPGPQGDWWLDEFGIWLLPITGLDGAAAETAMIPNAAQFDLAAVPGEWQESTEALHLVRPSVAGTAPFDDDLSLQYDDTTVTLAAGRANAATLAHDLPLGAVTVTLKVRNDDGSLRPFANPAASVVQGGFDGGGFSTEARHPAPPATVQHVRVLAPPGVWSVDAQGDVPENDDGTGPSNPAAFPTLEDVPFRPPRPDGSCDAICVDDLTGKYVGDDGAPPVVTVDPVPPARTTDASVELAGAVTDESPIESVTVNGAPATLGGSEGDTSRTFDLAVPLDPEDNTLTVVATDGCGEAKTLVYRVFRKVNHPPQLLPPGDSTVAEGDLLAFTLIAHDPDGDALTYSMQGDGLPARGPTLDPATGDFSWRTDLASEGVYPVVFTVSDGRLSASAPATITVTHVNAPPVILTIGGEQAYGMPVHFDGLEGRPFALPVVAFDLDGDALTYAAEPLDGAPKGWTLGPASNELDWTPDHGDAGDYVLFVSATDPSGAKDEVPVFLHVAKDDRPPTIDDGGERTVDEGEELRFDLAASDPDVGDVLTFDVKNASGAALPEGFRFTQDGDTLHLDWQVGYDAAGEWAFDVSVSDGNGGVARTRARVTVVDVDRPPVFGEVPTQHPYGFAGSFHYTVKDPDGDALTCVPLALPPGGAFDPFDESVHYPELPEGDYDVKIRCSDGRLDATLDVVVDDHVGDLTGGCACSSGGFGLLALLGLVARKRRRR